MSEDQQVKPKSKKAGSKAAAPGTETGGEAGAEGKAERARSSKNFNKDLKISLLTDKNPKREGSKAHVRFAHYKDGQTVGEFISAGGTFGDLAWDASRGYISIEGYTPKVVVKKEPKPKADKGAETVEGGEKAAA